MTDEVNNPQHYNVNGIEVIDVIETYAKHDFRLANVLKYVCRAGYKGRPLQDLQKAQWYLNRVVSEMEELEVVEALTDESWLRGHNEPEPVVAFALDGYYSVVFGEDDAIEKKDELYQTFVHPAPDRIAGDNDEAKRLKDTYYDFNRFEIKGYCANCDKELAATQPHVTDYAFDEGVKFCSAVCAETLKVWQGR